ncbi:hypothetical protein [Chitinophaga sp. Cy-1792]|uniref:hypothetical protein n=1 Tax=Chitinophaga sp. Cy-1792 TaxID=2608339 RepID=UPI00142473C4|nr:hypothetical protein [Chitinophaga sp. Cy-1792]NIG55313.1 hypothetical protein [Chitinophaga sp. Cy-1792]
MFDFMFWFLYKYFEKKNGYKSVFQPATFVTLSVGLFIALGFALIRLFTGWYVGSFSRDYETNKLCLAPFVLGFLAVLYFLYFKPQAARILLKYQEREWNTTANKLVVLALLIVPLVLTMVITNVAVHLWQRT